MTNPRAAVKERKLDDEFNEQYARYALLIWVMEARRREIENIEREPRRLRKYLPARPGCEISALRERRLAGAMYRWHPGLAAAVYFLRNPKSILDPRNGSQLHFTALSARRAAAVAREELNDSGRGGKRSNSGRKPRGVIKRA